MSNTHFHFVVWAAEGVNAGQYSGVTYVDVIAEDADSALEKTKKLVKKNYYWINNIVEHHPHETQE